MGMSCPLACPLHTAEAHRSAPPRGTWRYIALHTLSLCLTTRMPLPRECTVPVKRLWRQPLLQWLRLSNCGRASPLDDVDAPLRRLALGAFERHAVITP